MKMHTAELPGARGAVANAILCSRNCDLPRVADPCKSYWINGASLSLKSTFDEFCLGGKAMKVTMTAVVPFQTKKESGIYVPRERHQQVLHSTTPERLEVVKSLETWAQETLLPFIRPVEKCWQPQDYLPHPSSDGFYDELRELRARAADLPDEYLVVLVGSMITEDALPTYQTMLNSLDGTRDETGASNTPWAIWTRAWTSEEKRHGDLLSKYLYLNGRVNMRSIEKTVQYLIGSGMDPKTENNPYLCFVYTSFQERATFISHGNIARRAKLCGDRKLASLCGIIAADEKRHEHAYCKIVEKLFEVDPDGAMVAFGDMMSKNIVMPAHLMYDGQDQNLYSKYSVVSHRTGTYTTADYISILEHLVKRWNVEKIEGLSSEGRKAQSFLCTLPGRLKK